MNGIEPLSSDWKSDIIAVILHLRFGILFKPHFYMVKSLSRKAVIPTD